MYVWNHASDLSDSKEQGQACGWFTVWITVSGPLRHGID
jgi:hypothetical protein